MLLASAKHGKAWKDIVESLKCFGLKFEEISQSILPDLTPDKIRLMFNCAVQFFPATIETALKTAFYFEDLFPRNNIKTETDWSFEEMERAFEEILGFDDEIEGGSILFGIPSNN